MALEFSGQIPFFLSEFLSRPASALPKNSLWVVEFENMESIRPTLLKVAELERAAWNIEENMFLLTNDASYKQKGCLFVHRVQVPGDSFTANPEGIQQHNLVRTFVGAGRDSFTNLQITFLDTNVSFVENIIRPWVLATARFGMKYRSEEGKRYRINFCVYKLGVISPLQPPTVLQKYTFYNACPTSVSMEDYSYDSTPYPLLRDVSFIFDDYSIDTITDNIITAGGNTDNSVGVVDWQVAPGGILNYDNNTSASTTP